MTEQTVRDALQRLVSSYPSQRAAARALGVSAPYLIDMLRSRRGLSPRVLAALGIERMVTTTTTYRRRR